MIELIWNAIYPGLAGGIIGSGMALIPLSIADQSYDWAIVHSFVIIVVCVLVFL